MPPRCECRMKVSSKKFTTTFNVRNKITISSPSKTKLALTIKTIFNKRGIAREIVRALGTSARYIGMAFIHFKGMGLATFVNVQYTVKKLLIILNYPIILSHRRSTTASLEPYPLYSSLFLSVFCRDNPRGML